MISDDLKIGTLVRWWGAAVTDNDQDVDDVGIVTREEKNGVTIWWSVCNNVHTHETKTSHLKNPFPNVLP